MKQLIESIYHAVLDGDLKNSSIIVQKAIAKGNSADQILQNGLIPAMAEAGRLFEEGEYFVPELLIAAQAMKYALHEIKPLLIKENVKSAGRVVIGTVQGDVHEIGKSLVAMMMEGTGFEVYDMGTDVSPRDFVEKLKETNADVLAMSALLTTTMFNMEETIQAIKKSGLRNKVKIIVGGAPVTKEYAERIGADGYSPDANRAVKLVLSLIK